MPSHEKTIKYLADYILNAVDNNYLLFFLITSHTQGKIKDAENLPFGMGKTTLLFWLNKIINRVDEKKDPSWDLAFQTSAYNTYDFFCLLDPIKRKREGRLNFAGFDDLQASCPAEAGVPRAIRRMSSYLTTNRPEVACIGATADNINNISAPLRRLVMFEIIVAHRGEYEIQKITYHKNYKKPLQDIGKLEYIEEGTFNKLPPHVEARYVDWRVQNKAKVYPQIKAELLAFSQLKDWSLSDLEGGAVTLKAHVIRSGRDYVIKVPEKLGEKLHRRTLSMALSTEEGEA
jgi:hypothetical protein